MFDLSANLRGGKLPYWLFALACFTMAFSALVTGQGTHVTCNRKGPCSCEMSDGTGMVDFSDLGTEIWVNLTGASDGKRYYFHPCFSGLQLGSYCNADNNAAVCGESDDGNLYSFGAYDLSEFSVQSLPSESQELVLKMVLSGGSARRISTFEMTCLRDIPTLVRAGGSSDAGLTARFSITSPCICPNQCSHYTPSESHSTYLSPGSILLIIFVVLVAFYAIVGIMYQYTVRGARGLEIIPNYSFWMDFPSLIMDGVRLIFCMQGLSKKSNYSAL